MRKVCYVTGTRADFGLIERTLKRAQETEGLDISICVTGAHLDEKYGYTYNDVKNSSIRICGKIPVELEGNNGSSMASAIGNEILGITEVLSNEKPDLLMVLGDRGEMLAGAIAAIHLNIPVVHIHGGERSGTIDELLRHAISKLSHYHFVTTNEASERLIRMGEKPKNIFVTGAPGLDSIREQATIKKDDLYGELGLLVNKTVTVVIFHPVHQDVDIAAKQAECVLKGVTECETQIIVFTPNSDAGGESILRIIRKYERKKDILVINHLDRKKYISLLAAADVMVGNSSSGIIEAASLNLAVINVGERQMYRERSENTIDVEPIANQIREATCRALNMKKRKWNNIYGDGLASGRIVEKLKEISLDNDILKKVNTY